MTLAIKVENLSKNYKDRSRREKVFTAVDHISFSVPKGTIFGLLGPNGAGKTSVIKMMCGLLTPTTGDVEIYGQSVLRERRKILQNMGTLLEGRRNLYWRLTVQENLQYFGQIKLMRSQNIKKRIDELIEWMGLQKYQHQEVGKLSTGNQQKVSLAATMIHEPRLILLDEPTLGLDVEASLQLREIIRGLVQDKERTVFLTTHDMKLAQEVSQQFLILIDGQINSQFDHSVFQEYSDVVTYTIEVHPTQSDVLVQFATHTKITGVLECKVVAPHRLKVILKSPTLLPSLLSSLEDHHLSILDLDKNVITLEEIFLNAKAERVSKGGAEHPVSTLVSSLG